MTLAFLKSVENCSFNTLMRLAVRKCAIDDEVISFLRQLPVISTLKSFECSASNYDENFSFLLPWLKKLPELRKLFLSLGTMAAEEKRCFEVILNRIKNSMKELHLSCCSDPQFDSFEAADVLAACLPSMKFLYELHIHRIPEKESQKLETILKSCHHFKKLNEFQLEYLSLRKEGIELLCEALRQLSRFQKLKSFRLFNVEVFSEQQAPALFCSIMECRSSLTHLQLSSVGIGDANIEVLVELCLQMEWLETLDLRYNNISANALWQLNEKLAGEGELKSRLTLRLDKNPGCDSSEGIKKLQGIFKAVTHEKE
jgi:hypothetical protein